jgi:hypothetical protein
MFLWANLMLEILEHQTTEDDIRSSLDSAPLGTDDMITEILKVYSSILKRREGEEFNTILAWLARAARPLTLAEIDAVLRRLSPTAAKVLSLEQKLRDTYSSLLELLEMTAPRQGPCTPNPGPPHSNRFPTQLKWCLLTLPLPYTST